MERTSRSVSATGSSSPREQDMQLSRHIPDIFQTRPRGRTQASQAAFSRESHSPSRSPQCSRAGVEAQSSPALNLDDVRNVASEIKSTLTAAISDLRSDIQAIALRVEEVEITQVRHDVSFCHVQQITESHAMHLREINGHMEDLDNRRKRCNLR